MKIIVNLGHVCIWTFSMDISTYTCNMSINICIQMEFSIKDVIVLNVFRLVLLKYRALSVIADSTVRSGHSLERFPISWNFATSNAPTALLQSILKLSLTVRLHYFFEYWLHWNFWINTFNRRKCSLTKFKLSSFIKCFLFRNCIVDFGYPLFWLRLFFFSPTARAIH